MSEVINEISIWITNIGSITYVIAGLFLMLGVFLIRVKVISASGRSVSFNGKNSGLIITGDINKTSSNLSALVANIIAFIGVIISGLAVFIAYSAWQFPVSN